MPEKKLCRHCGERVAARSRGLCRVCYYTPGVRELYAVKSTFYAKPQPTQEEVDRMVEEQMQCLPDWWDKEESDKEQP